MSHARRAGYRGLRGFGWCVALPFAVFVGGLVGLVFSDATAALASGISVSLFGLLLVSLGYSLGDIWESYWMVSVALVGGEISWLVGVMGGSWGKVLLGTVLLILMAALGAAILRTSRGSGGIPRLLGCFVQSLIPGAYSSRRY